MLNAYIINPGLCVKVIAYFKENAITNPPEDTIALTGILKLLILPSSPFPLLCQFPFMMLSTALVARAVT